VVVISHDDRSSAPVGPASPCPGMKLWPFGDVRSNSSPSGLAPRAAFQPLQPGGLVNGPDPAASTANVWPSGVFPPGPQREDGVRRQVVGSLGHPAQEDFLLPLQTPQKGSGWRVAAASAALARPAAGTAGFGFWTPKAVGTLLEPPAPLLPGALAAIR